MPEWCTAACGSLRSSIALSELDRLVLRFSFAEVLMVAAVADLRSCLGAAGLGPASMPLDVEANLCKVDCLASPLLR